jgi:hypothetical protein
VKIGLAAQTSCSENAISNSYGRHQRHHGWQKQAVAAVAGVMWRGMAALAA